MPLEQKSRFLNIGVMASTLEKESFNKTILIPFYANYCFIFSKNMLFF